MQAIEIKCWTKEDFGVLELLLSYPQEWQLAELASVLGPLQPVPRWVGELERFQGIFEETTCPAWAAVYISVDRHDNVSSIAIRTEPPDPFFGR